MNKEQIHSHFKLLDQIIEDNPHLDDQQIVDLFQQSSQTSVDENIVIISDNLSDHSERLLDSAISSSRPEDPKSTAQYEIGEKISTGGQSDVYLAYRSDGTFKKTVIMKVLKHKYTSTEDRAAFLKEIQILADLQHPNVVKIIDAGFNAENEPWMVLEYLQGLHLDAYIEQNNLSTKAIVRLIIDISESLSYIHNKNINHLDIKPANIIVKMSNGLALPYLIDFGISDIQVKANDIRENKLATPAFASPEQLSSSSVKIDFTSNVIHYVINITSFVFGKH